MIPAVLIGKKRDGQTLARDEIQWFIDAFTRGEVADYQMSAMAMAICLRGMDAEEIAALTAAMLDSGDRLPRSGSDLPRVDKHSTGGLGDKVSLVLAPLLASAGVRVPMVSGRGLGFSGGTLDKLEAIPGFSCDLSVDESLRVLHDVGCHIISASDRIAPADRRLYALRDVTGTVESVALITASILSKKLAASLDALVMDVKVGGGAFMKTIDDARSLARSLVDTGAAMDLPVTAMLTDMDQPLGRAVGNAVEVNESIDVLCGEGPRDVRELTLRLSAELLTAAGVCATSREAMDLLSRLLDDGSAMETFERMIAAQGGSLSGHLSLAPSHPIVADRSGFIRAIDCRAIAAAVVATGGGRRKAGDVIDPSVGIEILVSIGDEISAGQELGHLLGSADHAAEWMQPLRESFTITETPVGSRDLIIEQIGPTA